MSKIPVFATVSRAYGFLLGDFGTIARLAWAPLLVGSGLSYVFGGQAIDASIAGHTDPAVAMQQMPQQFLIGIISFVAGIIATVALLRVVIFGDRKPGLPAYLWLGAAELRLILVTILLLIAFIAAMFGIALVFGVFAAIAAAVPALALLLPIAALALLVVSIWVPLRLSLIGPVVVGENNLGVERSWALTKGNALRMLGVLLLTYLPYVIVSWLILIAILGSDFPAFPAFPNFADPDIAKSEAAMKTASEAFQAAMTTWQLDFTKAMRVHWLEINVLGFIGNLVSTALWTGATGTAYTTLVPERQVFA
jgi:hypothetical protein